MGDWANLAGTLIQLGLPQIGGLLAGPLGRAGGSLIGSMIAGALGVSPTPEAVTAAVQADPSAAQAKLAQIEANAREVEAAAKVQVAEIEDRASARAMNIALTQTGGWTSATPAILTYMIFAAYMLLIFALFFVDTEIPERLYNLLLIGFGTIGGLVAGAAQFWFGSTKTSQKKDETINKLSGGALPFRG
jgi:hypothetical protein